MQIPTHSLPVKSPFFSVLILLWNSNPYIHQCLQSLNNQTFKDFEIVLVDNGSPDPLSLEISNFPDLVIKPFKLTTNIGFAAGNNYAARQASGQYLVLLNSDAFPQPDWLAVIYQAIPDRTPCSFASKLIMANSPHLLDGEGDIYHATGLVWRRSYGYPVARSTNVEKEVFSACGAAAVYPKQAFDAVNGFDDDYFAYTEDVDLGFRLRLMGVACVYLPSAVVHHVGSGSTSQRSDLSVYYGQRNLVWTFFKNMPGPLLVLLLPFHLLMNLGMVLLSCFRKQGRVVLRAKKDAFSNLGMVLGKRKTVQKQRSISLFSLVKLMDWNPFSPAKKLLKK
jgi:GT2 family glycosyltransferase